MFNWFDWIDKFSPVIQIIIGVPIGLFFIATIVLSIEGIKKITDFLKETWKQ